MAKKIPVMNSPWGREFERPYDCKIWCDQRVAYMQDGVLIFRQQFLESQKRRKIEFDPTGFDDGTARRWTTRESDGVGVKQLLPVSEAGSVKGTTKRPDKLQRRTRRFRTIVRAEPS